MLELADDVIAFFSGLNPVHEILQPVSPQTKRVDALGKHPRKKQGVIANMLAQLALPIKRWRRAVHWIGLEEHFPDIGQRFSSGSLYFKELFGFAEFRQDMGDVGRNFRIAKADFFRVAFSYQFCEELLQGMRFRYHLGSPPSSNQNPRAARILNNH